MRRILGIGVGVILWGVLALFVYIKLPAFNDMYADFGVEASYVELIILDYFELIVPVAGLVTAATFLIMSEKRRLISFMLVPLILLVSIGVPLLFRISALITELS